MTPIHPLANILDTYAFAWRARRDLAGPTLTLVVVFGSLYFGLDVVWPGIVSGFGANLLITFLVSVCAAFRFELTLLKDVSNKHEICLSENEPGKEPTGIIEDLISIYWYITKAIVL